MVPFIPLLALVGIIGGVSALAWYSQQTPAQQEAADRAALRWFGKRFHQLAKSEQQIIRDRMS